jgi:hypothetical protein
MRKQLLLCILTNLMHMPLSFSFIGGGYLEWKGYAILAAHAESTRRNEVPVPCHGSSWYVSSNFTYKYDSRSLSLILLSFSLYAACDYGDPQPRPRFIIVAARSFIPLPLVPISTHTNPNAVQYKTYRDGSTKPKSLTTIGRRLDAEHGKAPWVVAGDVLEMFLHIPKDHFPNMSDRKYRKNPSSTTTDAAATSDPDDSSSTNNGTAATHNKVEEDVKELFADQLASAILASGPPVLHYAADAATGDRQCLSVRDVAALQSYPNGYAFFGTLQQKYKQVGNSVPCGLATALAQSAATVLRFVYRGEDDRSYCSVVMTTPWALFPMSSHRPSRRRKNTRSLWSRMSMPPVRIMSLVVALARLFPMSNFHRSSSRKKPRSLLS